MGSEVGVVGRLTATLRSLYAKMLKFGVVGVVGVGTDFVASNLLWKLTTLDHAFAGVLATAFSTVVGYVGSRFWVFQDRPDEDRRREMMLFVVFSLVGMGIENGAIYVTDHWFGFHSVLAADVAKYGFGLPVAGAFRFWAFNVFVFPEGRNGDGAGGAGAADGEAGVPSDIAAGVAADDEAVVEADMLGESGGIRSDRVVRNSA